MKKINWKVRLKNPYFYITLLVSTAATVGTVAGVQLGDMETWGDVGAVLLQTVKTPYMFVPVAVSVFSFVIDPTTKGVKDSKEALEYNKPKE